jgi:hypothetical protein
VKFFGSLAVLFVVSVLVTSCNSVQESPVSSNGPKGEQTPAKVSAEPPSSVEEKIPAGRMMRRMVLVTPLSDVLADPSKVKGAYAVVVDWAMDLMPGYVSILATQEGEASLYSDGDFLVIGGGQHESVKKVAKQIPGLAKGLIERAKFSQKTDYPDRSMIRFNLVTAKGVKILEVKHSEISKDPEAQKVFEQAQDVLTAIRKVDESMQRDN